MTVTHPDAVESPVRSFAELSRRDVEYAGGKGANLGELTAAGIPVPDGFVVGAPAYRAFVDHEDRPLGHVVSNDGLAGLEHLDGRCGEKRRLLRRLEKSQEPLTRHVPYSP